MTTSSVLFQAGGEDDIGKEKNKSSLLHGKVWLLLHFSLDEVSDAHGDAADEGRITADDN